MKAENIFFAESYTVCINLIKQNFEQLKLKKEVFPSPPPPKKKKKKKKKERKKKKREEKCGSGKCSICALSCLAEHNFLQLKYLPDSMPSNKNKHYKHHYEVKGTFTVTDEFFVLSLKATNNKKHSS